MHEPQINYAPSSTTTTTKTTTSAITKTTTSLKKAAGRKNYTAQINENPMKSATCRASTREKLHTFWATTVVLRIIIALAKMNKK